jgi:hypothetical protein
VVVVAVTANAQAYNAIPFWLIGQSIRALKRQAFKSTLYFDSKSPRAEGRVVVTPAREAYETMSLQAIAWAIHPSKHQVLEAMLFQAIGLAVLRF